MQPMFPLALESLLFFGANLGSSGESMTEETTSSSRFYAYCFTYKASRKVYCLARHVSILPNVFKKLRVG